MQSGCLSTFSIGFEDIPDHFHGKADESKQAEWFANKLNTKHTTIKVNDKYFYDLLDEYTFYGINHLQCHLDWVFYQFQKKQNKVLKFFKW